ncbi:hypothetical protein BDZ88DRAFT_432584 [Geranomyces variabilis]|nr:hypothetical protein BDZ88DRAFT_432584 [Geranomyces variabilis]
MPLLLSSVTELPILLTLLMLLPMFDCGGSGIAEAETVVCGRGCGLRDDRLFWLRIGIRIGIFWRRHCHAIETTASRDDFLINNALIPREPARVDKRNRNLRAKTAVAFCSSQKRML